METLAQVHSFIGGFFALAAIHYAVHWFLSRGERVVAVFAIQCAVYAVFCACMISFIRARTIADSQTALVRFVTIGMLSHVMVLEFYACLANRRGRAFRAVVTGVLLALAIVNLRWPLRGTVIELRQVTFPSGGTGLVAIRTPSGVLMVLVYVAVIAIQIYGLFTARMIGKRDRAGGILIVIATAAVLFGAGIGALIDFANMKAPYAGATPHAVFVLCVALFLARQHAARGAELAASERRTELALRETQQALADLQAEQRRREEVETARQNALQAVVQAQRNELASQLAAGVAHDFNNVLNVMSLWSAALMGQTSSAVDKDAARNALTGAQKQGQALTRQLMALARPTARSVSRFSLDRPIQTTLQALKPALPRTVQLSTEATDAPEIEADETEIQQVIYNLVLNARDAMPSGGAIVVTAGVHTAPLPIGIIGGSLSAGRWATLTVSDSGPGIDPAIRDRIFDLFFTTKGPERGTGLGLATVLRIARGSGGGVALETEAGRGATFRVFLPPA